MRLIDPIELKRAIAVTYMIGDAKTIEELIDEQPDAQPPTDEWCTDCKEYDSEKHCCPRWNRVIRQTLADAQPEPQRGNWLMRDGRVICSNCENVPYNKIEYDGTVVYHIPKIAEAMKYCPICGARMK